MKINELITQLQEIQQKHGDIPVIVNYEEYIAVAHIASVVDVLQVNESWGVYYEDKVTCDDLTCVCDEQNITIAKVVRIT